MLVGLQPRLDRHLTGVVKRGEGYRVHWVAVMAQLDQVIRSLLRRRELETDGRVELVVRDVERLEGVMSVDALLERRHQQRAHVRRQRAARQAEAAQSEIACNETCQSRASAVTCV